MAIPIDVGGNTLWVPQTEQEINLLSPKPVVPKTEPTPTITQTTTQTPAAPTSYERWRDPYSYIEREPEPESVDTTAKRDMSFEPYYAPYQQETSAYDAPESRSVDKPFKPLVPLATPDTSTGTYNADWRSNTMPIEQVDLSKPAWYDMNTPIEEQQAPERPAGGGVSYDPRYGWIPQGMQRPPMVMPRVMETRPIRIQARPGLMWR